jgi:hypothetical protein
MKQNTIPRLQYNIYYFAWTLNAWTAWCQVHTETCGSARGRKTFFKCRDSQAQRALTKADMKMKLNVAGIAKGPYANLLKRTQDEISAVHCKLTNHLCHYLSSIILYMLTTQRLELQSTPFFRFLTQSPSMKYNVDRVWTGRRILNQCIFAPSGRRCQRLNSCRWLNFDWIRRRRSTYPCHPHCRARDLETFSGKANLRAAGCEMTFDLSNTISDPDKLNVVSL